VRQVNDHVASFHLPYPLAAFVGQANFMHSRRRSPNVVVEKMAGRHHAVSGAIEDVEILQFPIERVRSFYGKQASRQPAVAAAPLQVTR